MRANTYSYVLRTGIFALLIVAHCSLETKNKMIILLRMTKNKKNKPTNIFKFSDGDVILWDEQDNEPICLKSITASNDPVELTTNEARAIGKKLIELADKIDSYDKIEI